MMSYWPLLFLSLKVALAACFRINILKCIHMRIEPRMVARQLGKSRGKML